jgi:peptidoglycan/LPS O-acetylase OafA/YrhL
MSTKPTYRPEIDGIRAVSVVLVILFHAGLPQLSGGFVGVDVFFVISGFLITRILMHDISEKKFSFLLFYGARARRNLPALILVSLACVPFAAAWMLPGEHIEFIQSFLATNTFWSNILFWRQSGYFSADSDLKPLLHTWSLAIEMQFYLLYPVLFVTLWNYWKRGLWIVMVVLSAASFAFADWASQAFPTPNFYLLPGRAWELGVGAVLALTINKQRQAFPSEIGAIIGLALILISAFSYGPDTPFPGRWALIPVMGAALLIACSPSTLTGGLLSTRPLVAIGLISYSLYLWHQPLLAFARIRSADGVSWWEYGMLIAVAVALAALSYRFVEVPFRRRSQVSGPVFRAALAGAAIVVTLIGGGTYVQAISIQNSALAQSISRELEPNTGLGDPCDPNSSACRTGNSPLLLVWGDSFAMHLVDGLIEAAPNGLAIAQATKSVCGPFLDLSPISSKYPRAWAEGCLAFNRSIRSYIENTPSLRYAVLSSPFTRFVEEGAATLSGDTQAIRGREYALNHFRETLGWLTSQGIKPIVVAPPPSDVIGERNIGKCVARRLWAATEPDTCSLIGERSLFHDDEVHKFLISIANDFDVLWPSDYMCDEKGCSAFKEGISLYRDAGHLSREGSRWLARQMPYFETLSQNAAGF